MDWMDKEGDLSKAMDLVPIMEAFIKQVKAVVKEKLLENPEAVPGFKLRKSGNITAYEASKVAEILMSTNVLSWTDFLGACRYSESPMVQIWADKRGISKAEARKDLKERLNECANTRPKSPAIIKDHG
jgi:hypothetical protein